MNYPIFKRKIYAKLQEWKARSDGKTALLIEGARRVGKSTVAEEFGRNEYDDYLLIDFSKVGQDVLKLFDDISDLDYFFVALQAITHRTLPERRSLIIFDEVQFCPKARQAIKHLVKDHRYDYIETGSLISIKKNVQDILIPSEERQVEMYPMDFEEFLWATGKAATFNLIRYGFEHMKPQGDDINRKLMREFRLYMLVGGMPQAVAEYVGSNDLSKVDDIKRDIIRLYFNDFRKIDESGRAGAIYRSIPSELARNTLRYKVGSVIDGARLSRMGDVFIDLEDSKTVNFAYHANDPSVGFALHANPEFFKIFVEDTGLFVTLAFWDSAFTDNEIYRKLLLDKLPADLGYIYENIVAQMLKAAGHKLYYYTFKKTDEDARSNEIDFLIARHDKICPIEVKSSGYKAHKSLDEFCAKYSSRIAEPYLIYTKDLRREGGVTYLPVYMTSLL